MQASVIETPCRSGWAGDQILASLLEVAFDHHAGDPVVARCDLRRHVAGHVDLPFVALAAVAVRDVDHHLLAQARRRASVSQHAATLAAS